MSRWLNDILCKDSLAKDDLVQLLSVNEGIETEAVLEHASRVRNTFTGKKIYVRGLIEFSNICKKNCLYCGVRGSNPFAERYELSKAQIIELAGAASVAGYTSLVLQSGERNDNAFARKVEEVVAKIKQASVGKTGITLSCGEQSEETYKRWFDAGAHRYLLRVESSGTRLYNKIHPSDGKHDHQVRINALESLKKIGYQVGTGVMIGLPFQKVEDMADDLVFMKSVEADMVGMGPYIEHYHTPLYPFTPLLKSPEERLRLSLLMIAVLRVYMKNINIASSTALDALDPNGRMKAVFAGANILMPNLTPADCREKYDIYKDKPVLREAEELIAKATGTFKKNGLELCMEEWGDSPAYKSRVHLPEANIRNNSALK